MRRNRTSTARAISTIGTWFLIISCLWPLAPALAANRALIVSIGQAYAKSGLPPIWGPERDIVLGKELAQRMGFAEADIRVIREEAATRAAILEGLEWVREGTQSGGKALIYYSGHGYQIPDSDGDEEDGCDEVLVPADATAMDKFITDDEIAAVLEGMGKAEVVMLIDSCFSGTITRGLYGGGSDNVKTLANANPQCGRPVNAKSYTLAKGLKSVPNLVVLSATANNEAAYGDLTESGKGSALTQAIEDTIRDGVKPLTFNVLRDEAAKRIKTLCDTRGKIPHHPMLDGNPAFFNQDIGLTSTAPSYEGGVGQAKDNRELLERMVNSSKFAVVIKADKITFRLGEEIHFTVASTKAGYLNIVELQPDGRINVIYPNAYVSTNEMKMDGEIGVPRDVVGGSGFRFKGVEPVGKSMMVALVTRQPLNLFAERGLGSKLGAFRSAAPQEFTAVKAAMTRAVGVEPTGQGEPDAKEYGAASFILETVK